MLNSSIVNKSPSIVWLTKQGLNDKIDANLMHCKFINLLDTQYSNMKSNISVKYNGELINELTDFTANGSFKSLSQNVNYVEETGISFIRIKNMSEVGLICEDLKYIDLPTYEYLKKSKLEGDELLFSKTGANLGLAMVFPNNLGRTSLADNIFKVIYKKEFDVHYIASFFNCVYGKLWIERFSQGSAQPTIIKESFRQIKIPIPSPEIQKYIGDKVRKAEELRENAKKLEHELKDIINKLVSIEISKSRLWNLNPIYISDRLDCEYNYKYFYELEDKFIKSGLNVVEFGSLIEKKMSEPQTDSSDFIQNGIPVLRITDIQEDSLNFESCARISEEVYQKLKEFQLIPDDIIFGLSGTVGRAIVVPNEIPDKVITNRRVAKVTLKDPKLAHYIVSFLNSECGVAQMLREATGGVQKNLRLEDITKIKIPLPENKYIDMIASKCKEKVNLLNMSKQLIKEAKQDVEELIEGNFDVSKLNQS